MKIKLLNEKILPIMLCRISNDLFALKKRRIFYIKNLTRNKEKNVYQTFNEYGADKFNIVCIFEI